jgi:hypothetical protein
MEDAPYEKGIEMEVPIHGASAVGVYTSLDIEYNQPLGKRASSAQV